MIEVRDATPDDWPAMWAFMRGIIAAGDTFTYDPQMEEAEARGMWCNEPPGRTVVAVVDGAVAGTAEMERNRDGPGAHVATGSFMVAPEHEGRGVGRALVEDAVEWARRAGYRGIQFNAVAASNLRAVGLYRSLDFEVIGTVPDGFLHPDEGYVGLHVVYLGLVSEP